MFDHKIQGLMKWVECNEEDIDKDDIYGNNFDDIKCSSHGKKF